MKLTWHIVWKDLTRLRLPMALWAAIFFLEFALGVRLLRGSAPDLIFFDRLRLYDYLAYGLQVAVSYILVAALIHEDPLVGSTAFWPTRPISGLRLLGAKLLGFVLIFGVFPAVATLPWWLFCGYGAHEIYWAALDTFCLSILTPVVGLVIASLTGNMSRFLAGSFLTVAFLVISFTAVTKPDPIFAQARDAVRPADVSNGFHVLVWLGLVGFPMVAAHQFLTRRLVRSLVILGCILGALVYEEAQYPLITHFFVFIHSENLPMPTPPTTDRISIKLKDAYLQQADPARKDASSPAPAVAAFLVTDVPSGLYLAFHAAMSFHGSTVEWSWPDGTRYTGYFWPGWNQGHGPPQPFPRRPPPREWWEWMHARGRFNGLEYYPKTYEKFVERFFDDRPTDLWEFNLGIPPEVMARMRTDPPSCTFELRGDLVRWDPRPEFAAAPGNGWDEGAVGLRIGRMTWDSKGSSMDIVISEHQPSLGSLIGPDPRTLPLFSATIINRKRGDSAQSLNGGNVETMRIGTVSISWDETWFGGTSKWTEANKWVREPKNENWFSATSVVGSVGTVIGQFEKKVTIDRFTLKARDIEFPDHEPLDN